jgi:hypothetical protein
MINSGRQIEMPFVLPEEPMRLQLRLTLTHNPNCSLCGAFIIQERTTAITIYGVPIRDLPKGMVETGFCPQCGNVLLFEQMQDKRFMKRVRCVLKRAWSIQLRELTQMQNENRSL